MGELTQDDHKNLLVFLKRSPLKGYESLTHATLLQKISLLAQDKDVKTEEENKESKTEATGDN